MALGEGGGLTIEDDVVIKGNRHGKRAQVQCRVIYVFIAVIFVLFIMVMVGVMTYLLTKSKCSELDISARSIIPPRELLEAVTDDVSDTVTGYVEEEDAVNASSTGGSDGVFGELVGDIDDDGWLGRLPSVVIPVHYKLSVTPYFYQEDVSNGRDNFTFDGNVSITIRCKERTSEIILHMSDINVSELAVFSEHTEGVNLVEAYEEDYQFEFLKIKLNTNMVENSGYLIHIQYEGVISDQPVGFYYMSHKDEHGKTRWSGVTQMQPTYARTFTPCFDEPEFKAEFDITIRHRSDMSALSNGIELSSTPLGGEMTGWKQTVFKTTPKMSTYLLAIAVTHYVSMNKTTDGGTLIRVWSKSQDINYALYSLESAVKEISFYESLFNLTSPLEKQDMVAIPKMWPLAMENWGLIIYREDYLLYNPKKDSLEKKRTLALTVSHELAHQWFGNLVTLKWWDDIWLNEGFARYLEFLGTDYCEPNWNIMYLLDLSLSQALGQDSTVNTHPIRQKVNTAEEIVDTFDFITYSKGALVIRMLEHILGKEVFISGLRNYLRLHAYANTNTDDLWESFTKADVDNGSNDVQRIMDSWTLHPGYPLLTFNRTTDNIISVSQKMFLSDFKAKIKFGDMRHTWEVSISHTHESEKNYESPTRDWIHGEERVELSLSAYVQPTDWYLVNIGRYGFYRVNYDTTNWDRLIEQLLLEHETVPVTNRFQLLDDAAALFQVDELDVHILLNLTLYLHRETEYLPWYAASLIAQQLRSLLKWQPSYGLLQKYWQDRVLPIYRILGWSNNEELENIGTTTSLRRITIEAACLFEVEDCLQTAKDLYARFMDDPTNNPFPANKRLRKSLYCFAISQGGQREWEFALEEYASHSPDDWLDALSCTKQPWNINRLLQDAYDGLHGEYTFLNLVRAIGSHEVGLPVVWEFIQKHWDETWKDHGRDVYVYGAFIEISQYLTTEVHLQQLTEFGRIHNIGREYWIAINTLKYNIEKRARYSDDVTRWLSQHV